VKVKYQTRHNILSGVPLLRIKKVRFFRETEHFVYLHDDPHRRFLKIGTDMIYHETLQDAADHIYKVAREKIEEGVGEVKSKIRQLSDRRKFCDEALRLKIAIDKKSNC